MAKILSEITPFLDEHIAERLINLSETEWKYINEIRLRINKPVSVVKCGRILYVGNSAKAYSESVFGHICTETEIKNTYMKICRHSVYAYERQISDGYITLPGGHRAGLCGSTVWDNGIYRLSGIYGICIRIAKEITGCGKKIAETIDEKPMLSGIIVSSPGGGKTTILRDTARILSDSGRRVCVIDERGEIAAVQNGVPMLDVGINTDIIDGMQKSDAMLCACRSLCPDILIFDEIGTEREARAIIGALNCGVAVLTSIHGRDYESVIKRPQFASLLKSGAIDVAFTLAGAENPGQITEIVYVKDGKHENSFAYSDDDKLYPGGFSQGAGAEAASEGT